MSSLVLARKYRPRSFGEMVGQEHVVQALSNALASQRLHHAYLFTGTRGVGKTTVSRILAKSLNCTGPEGQGGITAQPCGVCRSCTEIDADRFIDYVEMDAASNRGIDEIRDLLERAAYKPAVGRFKVFMIDEVHQLTKDSFNALLKTLEEPPEYLKFVLATTDPEKVLPTVLSRCLQFNLRPMAPETVLGRLQQVLAAEQVAAEPGALRLLARAARGSMRDALSLTDQAIAFGAGTLAEAGVRQMLGSVGRGHVLELIEALAEGAGARVVAGVDALRAEGGSAEGTLEEMARVLQQMAVLQAVPGAQDADDPEAPAIAALAARLPADETQLLYSIVLHGRAELPLAPDEYAGLVMVLLRLLAFRPAGGAAARREPAVAAPAAATDRVRTAAGPGSAPGADRTEAPTASVPAAPTTAARVAAATPSTATLDTRPTGEPVRPAAVAESGAAARPAAPAVPLSRAPAAASVAVPAGAPRPRVAAEAPAATSPARPAAPRPEVPPWEDEPPPVDEWSRGDPETVPRTAPEPVAARPGPARTAPMAAREAPSEPRRTPLGDRWAGLVAQLVESGAVAALVRELALQSECVALDDGERRVVLRVERESLRHPGHAERLQAALAAALGHAVQLEVESGAVDDTPARREAAERARRQREAEALFGQDPLVQQLTEQFRTARVVPGSIKPL